MPIAKQGYTILRLSTLVYKLCVTKASTMIPSLFKTTCQYMYMYTSLCSSTGI